MPPITFEIEEAWEQEISARIKKFKEGKSKSIPADEVFAELDPGLRLGIAVIGHCKRLA